MQTQKQQQKSISLQVNQLSIAQQSNTSSNYHQKQQQHLSQLQLHLQINQFSQYQYQCQCQYQENSQGGDNYDNNSKEKLQYEDEQSQEQQENQYQQQHNSNTILCNTHNKPIRYICTHAACLTSPSQQQQQAPQYYLICNTQNCLSMHYCHSQHLLPYSSILSSIQKYNKSAVDFIKEKTNQRVMELLQLRVKIVTAIDQGITQFRLFSDKLVSQYMNNKEQQLLDVKQYLINMQNNTAAGQSQLQQLDDRYTRLIKKLNLNITSYIKQSKIPSFTVQHQSGTKKSYEYKLQGSTSKIITSLINIPKHINRLKLYVNSDVHGQYIYANTYLYTESNLNIYHIFNQQTVRYMLIYFRRIYKENYFKIMENLSKVTWIDTIIIAVWDRYLHRENKMDIIRQGRAKMAYVSKFILDDKVNNIRHQL